MKPPELRRVLEWRDPPLSGRGKFPAERPRRTWLPALADLQGRPGKWGVVCEQEPRGTAYVASSVLRRYGCEVTQRGPVAGPFDVYARWPAA